MRFKKLDFEKIQFQNGMSNNFQIREPIVLIEHAHELEPVGSVAEVKLASRATKVNKSNGPKEKKKKKKNPIL